MKKDYDDVCYIIIFLLTIFINIIVIFTLLGLANDLSDKVTILEKTNTELKQQITELKWQLEQVDQIICVNDMED